MRRDINTILNIMREGATANIIKETPYRACQYIPNNILEEMRKENLETEEDGLEHGFTMCTSLPKTDIGIDLSKMTDKNTLMTNKCTGSTCEMQLPECSSSLNRIGSFHTHPRGVAVPSFADIANETLSEGLFSCIGSHETINCFPARETLYKARSIPRLNKTNMLKFWEENMTYCKMRQL